VPGVREAIESASAKLRYLPQYSPDLHPNRGTVDSRFGSFASLLSLETVGIGSKLTKLTAIVG
jgi:hypothetical protein